MKKNVYQVNSVYQITKTEMDEIDIANSSDYICNSRQEAEQYCIDSLQKEIEVSKTQINSYQRTIESLQQQLQKKKRLLHDYEGSKAPETIVIEQDHSMDIG